MKKQLVAVRGHQDHPPQPVLTTEWSRARRVGLLDRAALHLGVALITWGRRPVKANRKERVVVSRENLEARRRSEELRDTYRLWGSDLMRLR
jgi:hypothetical protein